MMMIPGIFTERIPIGIRSVGILGVCHDVDDDEDDNDQMEQLLDGSLPNCQCLPGHWLAKWPLTKHALGRIHCHDQCTFSICAMLQCLSPIYTLKVMPN